MHLLTNGTYDFVIPINIPLATPGLFRSNIKGVLSRSSLARRSMDPPKLTRATILCRIVFLYPLISEASSVLASGALGTILHAMIRSIIYVPLISHNTSNLVETCFNASFAIDTIHRNNLKPWLNDVYYA